MSIAIDYFSPSKLEVTNAPPPPPLLIINQTIYKTTCPLKSPIKLFDCFTVSLVNCFNWISTRNETPFGKANFSQRIYNLIINPSQYWYNVPRRCKFAQINPLLWLLLDKPSPNSISHYSTPDPHRSAIIEMSLAPLTCTNYYGLIECVARTYTHFCIVHCWVTKRPSVAHKINYLCAGEDLRKSIFLK